MRELVEPMLAIVEDQAVRPSEREQACDVLHNMRPYLEIAEMQRLDQVMAEMRERYRTAHVQA